uniref:Uncharacterized protein n=1 Tax=Chaetoceros debilis TaxID=122233 RepID=A0A7S3V9B0_9STRA|mmetsp:Transcript_12115/g.18319  ORF Transcript_12115/g.18319 Transcript_12115/m.18319 type:complete len:226 (+) Transcript_12115:170-847(+)
MGKCTSNVTTTKKKGGRTPRIRRVVPSFKRVRQNTRNKLELIRTKVKNTGMDMPQCLDLRQMIKRNITKFRQITWKKNHGHGHECSYAYGNNNNDARAYAYVSSYAKDRRFRTKVSASMAASVLMSAIPGAGGVVAIAAKSASACILSTVVSDAYLRRSNNKKKNSRKKSPMDKAMDMAKRKRKHRHVPEQVPVPVPLRSADESSSSNGNNGSNREGVVFMKVNV